MGQIVCAVVADSDVHAKQAAAKVKIEYEMLEPVILTIEVLIISSAFLLFYLFNEWKQQFTLFSCFLNRIFKGNKVNMNIQLTSLSISL